MAALKKQLPSLPIPPTKKQPGGALLLVHVSVADAAAVVFRFSADAGDVSGARRLVGQLCLQTCLKGMLLVDGRLLLMCKRRNARSLRVCCGNEARETLGTISSPPPGTIQLRINVRVCLSSSLHMAWHVLMSQRVHQSAHAPGSIRWFA